MGRGKKFLKDPPPPHSFHDWYNCSKSDMLIFLPARVPKPHLSLQTAWLQENREAQMQRPIECHQTYFIILTKRRRIVNDLERTSMVLAAGTHTMHVFVYCGRDGLTCCQWRRRQSLRGIWSAAWRHYQCTCNKKRMNACIGSSWEENKSRTWNWVPLLDSLSPCRGLLVSTSANSPTRWPCQQLWAFCFEAWPFQMQSA